MSQAAPNITPLDGHARIESPLGDLTLSWTSFGTITDLFIGGTDAPHDVMAREQGLVETAAQTIHHVAQGVADQGRRLSFHFDERTGRTDELGRALVAEGHLDPAARFVQVRGKVDEAIGCAASAARDELPAVEVFDVVSNTPAWLALYEVTLSALPQRGVTTPAGARRQVEDLELPRPTFFAALDPVDGSSLIGAITVSAVASAPSAPPVGELAMLAVRPDWQRRGLGTKLVSTALQHLAEVSSRTALAYIDEGNESATTLFGRLGFQERGARIYYAVG